MGKQKDSADTLQDRTDVDPAEAWISVLDTEDTPPGTLRTPKDDPPVDDDDDDEEEDELDGGEPADADEDADTPDKDDDAEDDSDDDAAGDASDKDQAASDDALNPADFMFDVEGKAVDGEELIKRGLRQSDYTRKTQALVDEKKAFDEHVQAVKAERSKYAGLLDKLEERLKAEEPDWATLRRENPSEYAAQREDWRSKQDALEVVAKERQELAEKEAQDLFNAQQQRLQSEQEQLLERVPEWKEETQRTTDLRELAEYGMSIGFTKEELANTVDHRAILALRKAMLYDKLHKGPAQVARKKARRAPVTLKPGASKQPTRKGSKAQRARMRLKKMGSIDAAAGAFLAAIEEGELD